MSSLSVIVIGGGIGGLTSALALRRSGHKVTVYEKYSFEGEVGAAVGLGSNSLRHLKSLGFDTARAKLCPMKEMQMLDGRTLELLQVHPVDAGGGSIFRPDLRDELRHLAEEGDGLGPPCRLVGQTAVACFDPEQGIVQFDDGSQESADLIIAADGVHSSAMNLVLGTATPPIRTDTTVTRAVVPVEKLKQNPFAQIMACQPGRATFSVHPDGNGYLLTYWCHDFEYINFVLYTTKDVPDMVINKMRGETTREDVAAALAEFHPNLATVCDHLLDVLPLWRLHTRAPAARYTRGRLVVIGDAAHAMLSHLGQGANNAIHDAVALGTLLADVTVKSPEQISARLRIFDEVRCPRVSATQIWSEVPMFDDATKRNGDVQVFFPDTKLPDNKPDLLHWLHQYDVAQDCQNALRTVLGTVQ